MQLEHRSTTGRLPTSTFDLVVDGKVVGFTQVRHRPSHNADIPPEAANHVYYQVNEDERGKGYGNALLRLAKIEASRLGLRALNVTCEPDNTASRRIIENNGGRFLEEYPMNGGGCIRLYQIELDQ